MNIAFLLRNAALVAAGIALVTAPAAGETHQVTNLDPTRLYDVLLDGSALLTGLQPSPKGRLQFDAPSSGSFQIVPSGSGDTTPPGRVTDLSAGTAGRTSVLLTWTAPGDDGLSGRAVAYEISWSTNAGALGSTANVEPNPPSPAAAGSQETFLLDGLPPGTALFAAVVARDDAGLFGPLSNAASFSTEPDTGDPPPDPPPGDPGDTTPPDAIADFQVVEVGPSEVVLAWTATGDDGTVGRAWAYDLRHAAAPIDETTFGDAVQFNGTERPRDPGRIEVERVNGLEPATRYHFAIVIVDDDGNRSPVSASVSAETLPADTAPPVPPPPPSAPRAQYSTGLIHLTWSASSGAIGYHVYRRPDGEEETRLTASALSANEYDDDTIVEGRGYRYRVTAIDDNLNESAQSAATWLRAAASAPAVLAIEGVYPSPIRDAATFRFAVPEGGPESTEGVFVTLDIYDVAGRRVARVVEGHFPPGVSEVRWTPGASGRSFVPGLYMGVVEANGQRARHRIAIAR